VNTSTECERVRTTLMAALDGESDPRAAPDREHLSTCEPCRRWLADMQAMTGRLQGLAYPRGQVDLWPAVEDRLRHPDPGMALPRRLWPIGAAVLGWRALQLFIDLPLPVLHPLVPLAAAAAAMWLMAADPLAVQTSAPELQKRGA
jgi:anti-sigma factor RsiW